MATGKSGTWRVIGFVLVVFILSVPLSVVLFDVQYDYTLVTVAVGGAVLGGISGVLGSFAVLRQQSLVGDALSHAALPGVAIAFLLFGRELGWLLVGAGIAGWLGMMFTNTVIRTTRIKQDAALGMALVSFFAIGVMLLGYIQTRPDASQAGLNKFIFGQAAAMGRDDVVLVSVISVFVLIAVLFFWKEFKLITFNVEFASANGFPTKWLEIFLLTLIVVTIVLGLQLAGVILMVGLLIAPAVAARQWTTHLEQMVVLAALFGAFSGASGAIVSAIEEGLPTGPLIIVVASVIVLISIAFAPGRGVVWRYWQERGDRHRFAASNILRDIYRHAKDHNDLRYPMPEGTLVTLRGNVAKVGLKELRKQGLIAFTKIDSWILTDAGIKKAEQQDHNRKLWALYRAIGAEMDLPEIPENQQLDISTLLPKDALVRLETRLQEVG